MINNLFVRVSATMKKIAFPNDRRKSSQISSSDRPNSRRNRNSIKQIAYSMPPEIKDVGSRKRARFADVSSADYVSCVLDDTTRQEKISSAKINEARTSEYAFFKKLKGDASQRYHSCSEKNEGNQSKRRKSDDCITAKFIARNSCKDLGSSFLSNDITPVKRNSFSSPFVCLPESDDLGAQCEDLMNASKVSRDTLSMSRNTEEHIGDFRFRESNEYGGVFFSKRQKLFQWVRDVSFPEIDEHCSKGNDIVSVLLSRLLPDEDYNQFKESVTRKVKADTKSDLVACPELDNHIEKPYWRPLEFDRADYLDHELSNSLYTGGRKSMSSGGDSRIDLQHRLTESDRQLEGGFPALFSRASTISFPKRNNEHSVSGNIEELDECFDLNASLLDRESNTLLLGWDHDSTADQEYLPIIPQNSELEASWVNYCQQGREYEFPAPEFCISSFFLGSGSNSPYMVHPFLSYHDNANAGRRELAYEKSVAANSNHSPFSILGDPSSLSLAAECHYDNSHVLLSPQNPSWFMSQILTGVNLHSNSEVLCSSGVGLDIDGKCLSLSGTSSVSQAPSYLTLPTLLEEDISPLFLTQDVKASNMDGLICKETFNHVGLDNPSFHEEPSLYFQISMNGERTFPLLLEGAGHTDSEDVYF